MFETLVNVLFGKRIAAVIRLTWKAAFRFRLFWVLTVLLLGSVIALPMIIKDDGTARGFTQILLTYTLGIITSLLGLTTLWLSCGTLARDIEEAQIQMVAVKPIGRWQIWLGKWLGLFFLNAALLAIAGGSVFSLLKWRAEKLPVAEQKILESEIFVARGSLKEPVTDFGPAVDKEVEARLKANPMSTLDAGLLRKQIEEGMKAAEQVVEPNHLRRWVIDFGFRKEFMRDDPLFLRMKFHSPETSPLGDAKTYRAVLLVGVPGTDKYFPIDEPSIAAETYHEFPVPPNLFDNDGKLTIEFRNYNKSALLFPLDEGMEVLYREGSFGLNFARGLGIILCWLSLLAAVGLCAASFLSFPVATFFALTFLVFIFSTGTMTAVVQEGVVAGRTHEGKPNAPMLDAVFVPVFRALLKVVQLVQAFSPIESLSSGRSITWGQLGLAFAQIVLLMGGLFAWVGIFIFNRRELARSQVNA